LLPGQSGATLRTIDYRRNCHMNTTKIVAMLAAVLLTTAEFLVLDYDTQQRVVAYQAEASALAQGD
jgi:hypothetical protein